jgi:hypothetical protein
MLLQSGAGRCIVKRSSARVAAAAQEGASSGAISDKPLASRRFGHIDLVWRVMVTRIVREPSDENGVLYW